MKRRPPIKISHEFVEFIPDKLEAQTLYVSMKYATVCHKCFCGCGAEVVTPLNPARWQLNFDGETISLDPSVGSWSLPCKSHYWIARGKVQWADQWTKEEIRQGRANDRAALSGHLGKIEQRPIERQAPFLARLWKKIVG